jgi:hypothetical protein
VLEVYDAVQQASGISRSAEHAPARLGELQRSVLDPSLAERELGVARRGRPAIRPRRDVELGHRLEA